MMIGYLISSLILTTFVVSADFDIKVEYSIDDWASSHILGKISLESIEGNYTGTFKASSESKGLGSLLYQKKNSLYQIRSTSSSHPSKPVYSSTKPCLILRSRLMHEIFITISPRTRSILSSTVFPDPLFLSNDECPEPESSYSAHATVVVASESILPSPDTQSYLEKMEKEKKARQHGAESDNRSFIAKYWMYIVPVVIFLVISSAANPEGGAE